MAPAELHVQVCFGPQPPGVPIILDLQVTPGATIADAIAMAVRAGLLEAALPGLDLEDSRTGVWGKLRPRNTVLREHDRIEIYRGLIANPKQARRRRADQEAIAANRRDP